MDTKEDKGTGPKQPGELAPAGPHAKPELTDTEKTPGSGLLPDPTLDGDVDPGGG